MHLDIGAAKENNTGKQWMEQCFTHIEKGQSKISFSSVCQSTMANCPSQASTYGSLLSGDRLVVLARCHMAHRLKQNKRTNIESVAGKVINPAQAVRTLFLDKRVLQAQGLFICSQGVGEEGGRGQKTSCWRLSIFHSPFLLSY